MRDKIVSSLKVELDAPEEEIGYYESRIRLLSDFTNYLCEDLPADPIDATAAAASGSRKMLHPDLTDRVAPFLGQVCLIGAVDTMRALPSPNQPAVTMTEEGTLALASDGTWRAAEAAMILCVAGLVQFCKDTIDEAFNTAFDQLLEKCFHTPAALKFDYDRDAEPLLRRYEFTGALCRKERRRRFEDHIKALGERFQDNGLENEGDGRVSNE